MANPESEDEATLAGANGPTDERDAPGPDESKPDPERLRTELAVLREENRRLRSAYAAATRTRHRRTALGFAVLGVLAIVAGAVLPATREVLLALGGTGLFTALLVVYLSPERFVAASVGRDVYGAMADNEEAFVTELGLTDRRIYVPVDGSGRVRLFVPQHTEYELPERETLSDLLVVPAEDAGRGVSFRPTGSALVDEYERSASGDLADRPEPLAEGLAAALVEQFELVDSVSVDVEPDRVTMAVSESAFGPATGFDHPVGSVLAVGLARGLDVPVECSVRASADTQADWQVTCRWEDARDEAAEG